MLETLQVRGCTGGLSPQSIFIRAICCLPGNAAFIGNRRNYWRSALIRISNFSNDASLQPGLASGHLLTAGAFVLRVLLPSLIRAPFARYSHGIAVPAGHRLVFTSGQLGIDSDETVPADCEGQTELCFANIAAILAEDRMTLANVVRLNAYVTGREHMQAYMRVRDRQFSGTPPASTLMIVSGFSRPEFVVEIEAVAAAPT